MNANNSRNKREAMVSTEESIIRVKHSEAVQSQKAAGRIICHLGDLNQGLEKMLDEDIPLVWENLPVVGLVELQSSVKRLLDKSRSDKTTLDKRVSDLEDKLGRINYRVTIYDMCLVEIESCVFETRTEVDEYMEEWFGSGSQVIERKMDGDWVTVYDNRDYTYINEAEKKERKGKKK